MPPKKTSAAAASKASSSSASSGAGASSGSLSSSYESASRLLVGELGRLLETQQQLQQLHSPAQVSYAAEVARLTAQLTELEKPLSQLRVVQQEERARQKAATSAPAASSAAPSSLPTQPQLTELAAWLRAEAPQSLLGSHWEFEPRVSDAEGTGVRATRDLAQSELFMSIPRSVMLTTDTVASSSPIGAVLAADPLCAKMPSLLLACGLLYERSRGAASRWAAYIRCLPRHFNLPMLWPVDQVRQFLQASPTVYDVLVLQRTLVRQYVHLYGALKRAGFMHPPGNTKGKKEDPFDFTWADFTWAVSVVMSRQNRIPSPSGSPSIALIPGWDFCNHRGHGAVATFFDTDSQESQSHTMEAVKSGQPIYLYYGARTNAKLMTYAGFVDANHRSDDMEFVLTLDGRPISTPADAAAAGDDADPLSKIKLMLLKKANMGPTFGTKLPLLDFNGVDPKAPAASPSDDPQAIAAAQEARQQARLQWNAMMHFLRVASLRSKEDAALALKHKPAFGNPLSPSFHFLPALHAEHDLDALTFLHDAIVGALHAYPTTLEHDEAELLRDEARRAAGEHDLAPAAAETHPHMHAPHRLALEMRRSEKKLLVEAAAKALAWKTAAHPADAK